MNSGTWFTIYFPIIIMFIIIFSQQSQAKKALIYKIKKKKGEMIMTNEIIKNYIGMECQISTGTFGTNVIGKMININENWIEVETKKGTELVNAEFIQSIKIFKDKIK